MGTTGKPEHRFVHVSEFLQMSSVENLKTFGKNSFTFSRAYRVLLFGNFEFFNPNFNYI